jgi:hypothetical protein
MIKSTETLIGKARSALAYVEEAKQAQLGIWVGIGMEKSKWENDNSPPAPSTSLTHIPELLGLWFVDTIKLVYPDAQGGIYTPYGRYQSVPDDLEIREVASARATHVLLKSEVLPRSLPIGTTYRMLGVVRNVRLTDNTYKPKNLFVGTYLESRAVRDYELDWAMTFPVRTISDTSKHLLQIVRSY